MMVPAGVVSGGVGRAAITTARPSHFVVIPRRRHNATQHRATVVNVSKPHR